jgi:hypothetical protein
MDRCAFRKGCTCLLDASRWIGETCYVDSPMRRPSNAEVGMDSGIGAEVFLFHVRWSRQDRNINKSGLHPDYLSMECGAVHSDLRFRNQ